MSAHRERLPQMPEVRRIVKKWPQARLGDALLVIRHNCGLVVHHGNRGAARRRRSDSSPNAGEGTGAWSHGLAAREAGCTKPSGSLGRPANGAPGLPRPGDGDWEGNGADHDSQRLWLARAAAAGVACFPELRGPLRVRESSASRAARTGRHRGTRAQGHQTQEGAPEDVAGVQGGAARPQDRRGAQCCDAVRGTPASSRDG